MKERTLSVRREALTELTTDELGAVVGATVGQLVDKITYKLDCHSYRCTR